MPKITDFVLGSIVAVPIFFLGNKAIKKLEDEYHKRKNR